MNNDILGIINKDKKEPFLIGDIVPLVISSVSQLKILIIISGNNIVISADEPIIPAIIHIYPSILIICYKVTSSFHKKIRVTNNIGVITLKPPPKFKPLIGCSDELKIMLIIS